MVLQSCGCDAFCVREDVYFSEDDHYEYDENGETVIIPGIKTAYWPAPVARSRPEWSGILDITDDTLRRVLDELYKALDADLRVLAAIGARTAFDRASELLSIDPGLPFEKKLNELVAQGHVGASERQTINALVDAGSAAAHRGWAPDPGELATMMDGARSVSSSSAGARRRRHQTPGRGTAEKKAAP